MILLYDLCAGDPAVRFSPYCWRVRMALAHKGLDFATEPTPFTAIGERLAETSATVPVIDDNGRKVRDSFEIALYLEEAYADRPSLFGGPGGRGLARFLDYWTLGTLHPLITRLVVKDIHDRLGAADQAYFRASREGRLGGTLEAVQAGRDERIEAFRAALGPARATLKRQPWLGGETPRYPDYILLGTLQWPRVMSEAALLAADDPVAEWFERCLDLHGGMARAMPRAA
jgi:glutathione S-transferase